MQRLDLVVDGRRQSISGLPSLFAVQSHAAPASWHAHDYRQRPPHRAPTPHLIRNILGLDEPRSETVQPRLDPSSTCSVRGSASVVSSSSVGPDDDGHFGPRRHVDTPINGLDWSTSGRRAGHLGNSLTTSSAADTTLRGLMLHISFTFLIFHSRFAPAIRLTGRHTACFQICLLTYLLAVLNSSKTDKSMTDSCVANPM